MSQSITHWGKPLHLHNVTSWVSEGTSPLLHIGEVTVELLQWSLSSTLTASQVLREREKNEIFKITFSIKSINSFITNSSLCSPTEWPIAHYAVPMEICHKTTHLNYCRGTLKCPHCKQKTHMMLDNMLLTITEWVTYHLQVSGVGVHEKGHGFVQASRNTKIDPLYCVRSPPLHLDTHSM